MQTRKKQATTITFKALNKYANVELTFLALKGCKKL